MNMYVNGSRLQNFKWELGGGCWKLVFVLELKTLVSVVVF